jgi:hypothetical protein
VIAPRLSVTDTKGTRYAITQLGEAWVIDVAGGKYFLTAGNDPTLQARAFLKQLPKNTSYPRTPAFVASQRYPIVLSIDDEIVRAWPAFPTRDDPPKTYRHPYWSHRVTAVKDQPVWMFAARGGETSAGGESKGEQTIADVEQLARTWLHG